MKKIITLFSLLLIFGVHSFSQNKAGTIYSEHEYIEKSRDHWKAFVEGDEEKYRSFYADSAWIILNDEPSPIRANSSIGTGIGNWKKNYENFSIIDNKPAYPDALEYKDGGTWVQDWIRMKGIHKETGVVLDLPFHNLYQFNEEGKIITRVSYFNNDVFQEIGHSQTTRENGKIYINHPHIVTVRKAMNAFVAKDLDKWASFFADGARFTTSMMQMNESEGMDDYKERLAGIYIKEGLDYHVEQMGYPDCIYYEESNQYVVYSWWVMKADKEGKKIEFPFMLSHDFNDDGEIVSQHVYVSSNHVEKL